MGTALEEFIEDARSVSIEQAAPLLGLALRSNRHEHPQPCPICGGKDRFSLNTQKNKWNCRQCGVGGQDAIGLAGHVLQLDLKRRATFLEACAAVTGRQIPDEGERETEGERAARQARLDALKMQHDKDAAARAAEQNGFREKERVKARGIYDKASALATAALCEGRLYLERRGCGFTDGRWLRVTADQPYWHGQDERGSPIAIHSGPAMIAPFVDPDGIIIGCHITWIDLANAPKYRPTLADPSTGELLPTKKMRGTKKGGVIPLAGEPSARRWLGGEGIENGLAFGKWERFRDDTFYFAAGDLGNLAGPADPKSRFAHPHLTKPDKNGKERPIMIAGPVPLFRSADDGDHDAMVVPDHVDELVLLADGDSELVATAAAMARARERHARPGRIVPVVWPREGTDWAAMLAGAY